MMKHLLALPIVLVAVATWAGHTLRPAQSRAAQAWLSSHPQYRLPTDADCACTDELRRMRQGYGGVWKAIPDYHPYIASGDFNGDGHLDFAVAVIDRTASVHNFTLLVFNGPLGEGDPTPAFMDSNLDLKGAGLFFGPPRLRPYRLLIGRFESDSGEVLTPEGGTYRYDDGEI